jgi:parvulin-like peptidyl-prolyl isomerase
MPLVNPLAKKLKCLFESGILFLILSGGTMSFFRSIFGSLAFVLVIGLGTQGFTQSDEVLATVGSKKITKKEFDEKYKEVLSKAFNPPTKEQFLEELVRYEVGVMEAEKRNLENDPIVKERFRQVVYADLLEKEVGKKADQITVSEKEMADYYSKNPDIRTSHILIEIKPKATDKERELAKKRAQEIYTDVKKSNRPFADLVKLYSDDVISKKNGGDIGWHSSVTLVPEYYNPAIKLSKGQISPLVETRFGFHIIKLVDKRSYKDADKVRLHTAVIEQKKLVLLNDFFGKLKSKYNVKVYNQKL